MNGRKFIGLVAGLLALAGLVTCVVFVVLASNQPGDDGWGDAALGCFVLAIVFSWIFDSNIDDLQGGSQQWD